ncbi:gp53-like domain-containing protein [Citrobacter freundii complex sp. CFNIH9]|uniref:gp53-like domain-containing protein n=1 Tax=Citrobacter freundii complex sp. CFNIH9 TaxID=2077149 RepID=UPI0026CA22E9
MSKIARYQGNVRAFASNAQGMERTVFGGTNQADDLTSQITASFLRGWGIVGASEHPSLEDFNAAMYAMSQFIAYQHQMGVPEWHAQQEYHIGSICTHNGESYQSLQDANVGSPPPSAKWTPVLTSKNGLANLGLDTALAAKQPLSTQLTYFANHSDTEILQYLGVPSVISAAISSLVDSSPAALDTLNELAEALGNDPNFSTTVLNKLAGKQPLDATLTGLSGKNDAGLRAYLSLKSAAMRDVGSQLGQLPGMDLFSSTIAGTGEKALPDFNTGTGMFILKWGAIAAPTTSQDITTLFQTPFPNKCLRVFATADYEPGTGNAMYIAVNNSTLQRDRFVARFAGSANYTSGVYFGLGY